MAVCQNLVPLVNIKIAGKWMFIPLKIIFISIDPYPYLPYKMELSPQVLRPTVPLFWASKKPRPRRATAPDRATRRRSKWLTAPWDWSKCNGDVTMIQEVSISILSG